MSDYTIKLDPVLLSHIANLANRITSDLEDLQLAFKTLEDTATATKRQD